MKTSNYLLFLLLTLSCLFSCTKENLIPEITPLKEGSEILAEDLSVGGIFAKDLVVNNFPCILEGETLIVHNPQKGDIDFYNSDRYEVLWHTEDGELLGNGVQLDCICGQIINVTVIDLDTDTKASTIYKPIGCVDTPPE